MVTRCQQRGDARSANALLGALLRLAGEDLARRSVLQAVLPSLAARAWRRRYDRAATGVGLWDDVAELDVEMITLALERIDELAGTSPEWPSQAIVDVAYERLRWAAQVARRHRIDTVALEPFHDVAMAEPDRTDDEFGRVLLDAVATGGLRRRDAALIYASRVLGFSPAELAERERRDVRAVRSQRARAERTLVALSR